MAKEPEKPVKLNLDRIYVYDGKFYGPGEVELSAEVAADLGKSITRALAADAKAADALAVIDAAEDARREAASKP